MDRYLEPADRLNEVLGLIIVLTFKLTADLAVGEGPEAARELLLATRLQTQKSAQTDQGSAGG